MKAIMVMYDSLNRHMLPNYGCDWTLAPNFKRLAERTATFDNHYVGSMPCIPARRELHTGRHNFLHRSWGPYEPFDDSTFSILKDNNVYTHLVSDHYHYWEDGGATYHHRYSSWINVRGQEGDAWKGEVKNPDLPEHLGRLNRQDWVNRKYMQKEELTPQARTFAAGIEFLETNHTEDNWYLQIETFDPHEPFFTLKQWKDRYNYAWDGPHFDWPKYERVGEDPDAVEYLRYQYAALLTQCDHYLGVVIDFMDEHDMWDDTMLLVVTDHGFLLGEHDWWGKMRMPWYNETAHIPFFVWDPRTKKRNVRRASLTQAIDVGPTLLGWFGIPQPDDMQGFDLERTVDTDEPVRKASIYGMFGGHVNVTDGEYVYMRAPREGNAPLNHYTLMPVHMRSPFSANELKNMQWHEGFSFTKGCPVMRIPAPGMARTTQEFTTQLFDLRADPKQETPIENREVEERLIVLMREAMEHNDAPAEQFERLELS
ncbi:MAG: sulfatase-like hydrolase/transferase [Gammaproteobacteria bacterium]|nr:sulfatase-like hydrolase/transferase [Gammaproteobacteria bacterium]